jgi:hypothetical protein
MDKTESKEHECPCCGESLQNTSLDNFIINQKILDLIEQKTLMDEIQVDDKVFCQKHLDKEIEYFCKDCTSAVCVRCMFSEHNGHSFAQVNEICIYFIFLSKNIVGGILKQHANDLKGIYNKTIKINQENLHLVGQSKDDLDTLKKLQISNVEKGVLCHN